MWLYISMGDIQLVKGDEAFQKLAGNTLRNVRGTGAGVFEVVGQVTVLNIFHRDEDEVAIRVPAEKFDKEILALIIRCLLEPSRIHRPADWVHT